MSTNVRTLALAVFASAFIIVIAVSHAVVAQDVLTGDWTASIDSAKSDRIHLSLERRTERGGRNQAGQDFASDIIEQADKA